MKKDLLLGLSGKWAVIAGIGCYLLSRVPDGDSLFMVTIVAMLEIAGIWLFFGGIYRWNKEIKAKRLETTAKQAKKGA